MYQTFAECMHALLADEAILLGNGAEVYKFNQEFYYLPHGQDNDNDGYQFLAMERSGYTEPYWNVIPMPGAGEKAYREFVSEPRNGDVLLARSPLP